MYPSLKERDMDKKHVTNLKKITTTHSCVGLDVHFDLSESLTIWTIHAALHYLQNEYKYSTYGGQEVSLNCKWRKPIQMRKSPFVIVIVIVSLSLWLSDAAGC